jgi:transketolase
VIAKTVKGSGVSFMENSMAWHYLPMTEEQYKKALQETEDGDA